MKGKSDTEAIGIRRTNGKRVRMNFCQLCPSIHYVGLLCRRLLSSVNVDRVLGIHHAIVTNLVIGICKPRELIWEYQSVLDQWSLWNIRSNAVRRVDDEVYCKYILGTVHVCHRRSGPKSFLYFWKNIKKMWTERGLNSWPLAYAWRQTGPATDLVTYCTPEGSQPPVLVEPKI